MNKLQTHTLILGAGITGLWLHNLLNQLGYDSLLIDIAEAGNSQTLSSQGIIHGGTKYSLDGVLSRSTTAIANMPSRWLNCLKNQGEIDLSATQVLSPHQLMWSTNTLTSRTTAFFSRQALSSKVTSLSRTQYPEIFQASDFKGTVYQLNEPVIDVHSLLENLLSPWRDRCLQLKHYTLTNHDSNTYLLSTETFSLEAQHLILAAGEGNENILKQLRLEQPKMQRRPLHMPLAKGKLPLIYAHAIGANTKPLVTITSHQHQDGETVWYLGGNLAEEGVNTEKAALVTKAKELLSQLLPASANLEELTWASHSINRAEQQQSLLKRPDEAAIYSKNNLHIIWPTKLALVPTVGDKMVKIYQQEGKPPPNNSNNQHLSQLVKTYPLSTAAPLWDRLFTH